MQSGTKVVVLLQLGLWKFFDYRGGAAKIPSFESSPYHTKWTLPKRLGSPTQDETAKTYNNCTCRRSPCIFVFICMYLRIFVVNLFLGSTILLKLWCSLIFLRKKERNLRADVSYARSLSSEKLFRANVLYALENWFIDWRSSEGIL